MRLLLLLALLCTFHSLYSAEYIEKKDDSGKDFIRSVAIKSEDQSATLYVTCFPNDPPVQVQLSTNGVFFPDERSEEYMLLSVTHKFDRALNEHTAKWKMNRMKYRSAWYPESPRAFLLESLESTLLTVKLNRREEVYRFDFSDASPHILKVFRGCINF